MSQFYQWCYDKLGPSTRQFAHNFSRNQIERIDTNLRSLRTRYTDLLEVRYREADAANRDGSRLQSYYLAEAFACAAIYMFSIAQAAIEGADPDAHLYTDEKILEMNKPPHRRYYTLDQAARLDMKPVNRAVFEIAREAYGRIAAMVDMEPLYSPDRGLGYDISVKGKLTEVKNKYHEPGDPKTVTRFVTDLVDRKKEADDIVAGVYQSFNWIMGNLPHDRQPRPSLVKGQPVNVALTDAGQGRETPSRGGSRRTGRDRRETISRHAQPLATAAVTAPAVTSHPDLLE